MILFTKKFVSFLAVNYKFRRNFCHKNDYELVYSFSYVRIGSLVNKLKIQQTVFTGVALPISAVLEYQSILSPGLTFACLAVGTAMNVVMYGLGHLFYRAIGKIYLNEKEDIAKFAYVSFTGQRSEIEVDREDIILPDIDKKPGLLFTRVQFYDNDLVLKLNEKYYDFCNKELARKLFGEGFQRSERT